VFFAQAWQDAGLTLSTTSNEACKLFDAALTQYATWTNNETLGGIEGCLSKLKAADPSFKLSRLFCAGLLILPCPKTNISTRKSLMVCVLLLHALTCDSLGDTVSPSVGKILQNVLKLEIDKVVIWTTLRKGVLETSSYNVVLSKLFFLKFLTTLCQLSEVSFAFVSSLPLFSYVKGYYAFGLMETNFFDRAEQLACEALAVNKTDAWSVHTIAHINEMKAEVEKGLSFMAETETNWQPHSPLLFLFLISQGEYEAALTIYDSHIAPRCLSSGSMLDVVDTSSMLYRLSLEGVKLGNRWDNVLKITKKHAKDHILLFNDVHILMSSLGAKDHKTTDELLTTLQELAKSHCEEHELSLAPSLGLPLCQALVEFENGNCDKAVDLLYPIRYQLIQIGGSNAQRDVFSQLLIHAALNCKSQAKQNLAK
ncbi:TTC38 protein, partial [Nothocercus nigrocapillus]|nr:TTC38 protein [Nothocercus nigrocapillus]